MSNVVHFELDRKNRVYRAGDVISGTVVVDGRVGQRAKRIVLRTWWETEGKGTSTRGGKAAAILHEGAPPQGSIHRHGFHFIAPDAPFTYVGHHLSIEHHLQAVVELPMAPDLKVEETFVLTPGAVAVPAPDELLGAVDSSTPQADKRPLAAFGLMLAVFGVFTLPFPGVLLLVGGLLAVAAGLRKEIAASRVGEVSVEVEPRVVSPGDEVTVRVGIFPKQPVQVQGVRAALRAQEICESKSGNNKKRHRHVAHDEVQTLLGSTTVPGELRREVTATFVVPALGMWSFKAPNNAIRWDVEVVVQIPQWPDWKQTVPIVVWPPSRALPEAEQAAVPQPEPVVVALPRPEPVALPELERAAEAAKRAMEGRTVEVAAEVAAVEGRAVEVAAEVAGVEGRTVEVAAEVAAVSRPKRAKRPAHAQHAQPVQPVLAEPGVAAGAVEPTPAPSFDFASAVAAILSTRRYSPDRKERVAALVGRTAEVTVIIDRLDRPFGRTRTPGFEDGWVVRGRLRDSDREVEVHIPTARAEVAEGLGRGDSFTVSGKVTSWERLPERPVIRMLIP